MEADELSLATRAAWLSYVGNQTQEEIAGRLGVSRVKVNRLIGQAVRAGLVHVFVEGTAAECIALEERIASRWGLEFCTVAPAAEDAPLPLATLAGAGGHWLHRVLEAGPRLADRGRPWPHAGRRGLEPAASAAAQASGSSRFWAASPAIRRPTRST